MNKDKIAFGLEVSDKEFDDVMRGANLLIECLRLNKIPPAQGYSAMVNILIDALRYENDPEMFNALMDAIKKAYGAPRE
jgi:hypothetical protein